MRGMEMKIVVSACLMGESCKYNGLDNYHRELVEACEAFMAKVNGREHRITRRVPAEMLAEEGDPAGRRR